MLLAAHQKLERCQLTVITVLKTRFYCVDKNCTTLSWMLLHSPLAVTTRKQILQLLQLLLQDR